MPTPRTLTGLSTISIAFAFNIPFALLASIFDYPDILRRPAADVLHAFHDGGAGLTLTWYAFMLSAVMMAPLAAALGAHLDALRNSPALAAIGASSGIAAGLLQAVGLSRWVFVVPDLARTHADIGATDAVRAQMEATFNLLNAWGGVAIGEHLGQMFTVLFMLSVAIAQIVAAGRLSRTAGITGAFAAALIAVGLGEGVALAIGEDPGPLGLFTVAGYLGLTLWLILTGVTMLIRRRG